MTKTDKNKKINIKNIKKVNNYALIGQNLHYSLSKTIHDHSLNELNIKNTNYQLIELSSEEFNRFLIQTIKKKTYKVLI